MACYSSDDAKFRPEDTQTFEQQLAGALWRLPHVHENVRNAGLKEIRWRTRCSIYRLVYVIRRWNYKCAKRTKYLSFEIAFNGGIVRRHPLSSYLRVSSPIRPLRSRPLYSQRHHISCLLVHLSRLARLNIRTSPIVSH